MAKAIRVIVAARKETREANRVTVMCCENERRNAMKATPHATGWTARPLVHVDEM